MIGQIGQLFSLSWASSPIGAVLWGVPITSYLFQQKKKNLSIKQGLEEESYVLIVFLFVVLFWDMVSLDSPGWYRASYVNQVDLKLTETFLS